MSNVELVRKTVEQINAGDLDGARQVWTDASVVRFPDRTCHGPDEIATYFAEKRAAVEGFYLEILSAVGEDEDVFLQWRLTGRHVGPLVGVAGTGRPLEVDGLDHFVVRDGVVVSNFVVFDQMQFARQVGLLPPDGTRADRVLKAAFNARTKLLGRLRR